MSTDAERLPLTLEFDYRWDVVKSGNFRQNREMRDPTKKFIAQQISIDGER